MGQPEAGRESGKRKAEEERETGQGKREKALNTFPTEEFFINVFLKLTRASAPSSDGAKKYPLLHGSMQKGGQTNL